MLLEDVIATHHLAGALETHLSVYLVVLNRCSWSYYAIMLETLLLASLILLNRMHIAGIAEERHYRLPQILLKADPPLISNLPYFHCKFYHGDDLARAVMRVIENICRGNL